MTAAVTPAPDLWNARTALRGWARRAACRARDVDPELFFPVSGSGPAQAQEAAAKTICAGCRVQAVCLATALRRGEAEGIWGGATPEERRRARALLRRTAACGG